MGSSSSKDGGGGGVAAAAAASSSSAAGPGVRRTRSMGTRVFHTSCLGRPSFESDKDLLDSNNNRNKENGSLSDEEEGEEELGKSHQVLKQHDADADADDVKINDRSSRSTRQRSRFSFIPGNLSFRLNRAASFGSSSRPYSLFSNNATPVPNAEQQSLPSLITNQGRDSESDSSSSAHLLRPQDDHHIVSNQDNDLPIINNETTTGILPDADHLASTNEDTDIEFIQSIRANRRTGAREPVERSVRFSRTLSVGRLRDRVLRRSSFTDGLFGRLQHDREVGDSSQENERQVWGGMPTMSQSDVNADISPTSSTHPLSTMSTSMYTNQDDELDTSRPREARYHDIMEHRTDFLERRRRIRSQVRALQRLGSRFENLSGHERSCILAGQHRSGRCTCRTSNRTRNPDDDTSARASISRIVMLAEALFEVLDEIHQQSVVLSSRPSVSSLGSIPAPKEVVESMPVKIYTKLQKHQLEDVAQCYICLVEYEEGDCMRILPCHHEFHRTCIDKWLKEIHRVCPLCRGDVCRSDSSSSEN